MTKDNWQKLPSNEFEINKKSTFQSLLYDTAKFWKISRGAVESKSVVLINKEGKNGIYKEM